MVFTGFLTTATKRFFPSRSWTFSHTNWGLKKKERFFFFFPNKTTINLGRVIVNALEKTHFRKKVVVFFCLNRDSCLLHHQHLYHPRQSRQEHSFEDWENLENGIERMFLLLWKHGETIQSFFVTSAHSNHCFSPAICRQVSQPRFQKQVLRKKNKY